MNSSRESKPCPRAMRRASAKVYNFLELDFWGIVVVVVSLLQDLSVALVSVVAIGEGSTMGGNSLLLLSMSMLAAMAVDDIILEKCRGVGLGCLQRRERYDVKAREDDGKRDDTGCVAVMTTMAVAIVEKRKLRVCMYIILVETMRRRRPLGR